MTLSVFDAAEECPRREAIAHSGGVWDYGALAERVATRIRKLESKGVRRGSRAPVAVAARAGLDELIVLHALIEMRVPWLPLHPLASSTEHRALMARAGAAWLADGDALDGLTLCAEAPPVPAGTLAIVPTSGTSGAPKLAVLSRSAFEASARASEANLGWLDDDRWLLCMPLAHVGGISILTRCLLGRRCVALAAEGRFSVEGVVEAVASLRVTLLSVVPTMLHRLLLREPEWNPPSHVRAILAGGAAASERQLGMANDRGWPVLTSYGLTEACSQVTTQRSGSRQRGEAGAGAVLPGVEVRVQGGEVQVRGPTMMTRYLGEPSPFLQAGWFRTGDCGSIDAQGNLHLRGRLSDVIITGGENVHPSEVETVLEQCPGVSAVCVFAVPDEEWGQVLAAAIVGPAAEADIRAFAQERLAGFKRPKLILFCQELAKNAVGKLDRRATAAHVLSALQR